MFRYTQKINFKRLFSALNYYKLYIVIGNDLIDYAILKNQWFTESLIHTEKTNQSSIREIITSLSQIDPDINQHNLEIIIGLSYPLATIRNIDISAHLTDSDIDNTLLRLTKKDILGKSNSTDLDISYQLLSKDSEKLHFLVSAVRKEYLHELYRSIGYYSDNIAAVIPLSNEDQTQSTSRKWVIKLQKNSKIRNLTSVYYRKPYLNHALHESIENVKTLAGNNLFNKMSFYAGLLLLTIIIISLSVSSIYRQKEKTIISHLSAERGKYESYTNLLDKERGLKNKLSLINTVNDVRSTHAWTIHQIEKLLPKSIYLIGLEVSRTDSVINTYTLKGSVTNEIDLYNMMATMKTKSYIKDVVLNRTIKKNNQYSQFELKIEVR